MKKYISLVFTLTTLLNCLILPAQRSPRHYELLEESLKELRISENSFKTKRLIKKITHLNIPYDSLVHNIRTIDYYNPSVKTGYNEWNYTIDSLDYTCIVIIPKSYSTDKKYPVSFVLHGAVNSLNPIAVKKYIPKKNYNSDSLGQIFVYPAGWFLSPWWSNKQVKNLSYLLNRIKTEYNIDENNISLSGISDGGTGTIYQANKNITPWSNFKCYIGNPMGLSSISETAIYLQNLSNKPILFISTQNDPIFPPQHIELFLSKLDRVTDNYKYILVKGYQHNLLWLPAYGDSIRCFNNENKRNPFPTKIFWQTNQTDNGRNHWVIIEKLSGEFTTNPPDYAIIKSKINKEDNSGTMDVACNGNKIDIKTTHVKKYKLLLSPEMFDFDKKIEIRTNGELSYFGEITKNPDVLLHWFNQDKDRTMLFGYEINIKID